MKLCRSTNIEFKKDHIAILNIDNNGNGWMRIGYTGLRISHIDKNNLNIIGVDLV